MLSLNHGRAKPSLEKFLLILCTLTILLNVRYFSGMIFFNMRYSIDIMENERFLKLSESNYFKDLTDIMLRAVDLLLGPKRGIQLEAWSKKFDGLFYELNHC